MSNGVVRQVSPKQLMRPISIAHVPDPYLKPKLSSEPGLKSTSNKQLLLREEE